MVAARHMLGLVLWVGVAALLFDGTSAAQASPSCTSDLNCSLFGECRGGACICDAGWGGPQCATLQLLPVAFPQGYGMDRSRQADVNTSWGGNIIESDGQFHMYVNAIANQCLLGAWMRNSRIDHVVSETVTGPYTFHDTAVNMTSSNPAPVVLVNDTYKYAIFHIYNGTVYEPWVEHCYPNGSRMPPQSDDKGMRSRDFTHDGGGGGGGGGGSTLGSDWGDHQISVSNSLDGPWELLQSAPDHTLPRCNNPAPWVHPNGTLYCLCGSMYRADTIAGPWRIVSTAAPDHSEWPKAWHREDPFLFTTPRGWHVLFHASIPDGSPTAGHNCTASVVSAHMFSVDGFVWHASATSPYGSQVEVLHPSGGGGSTTTNTHTNRGADAETRVFTVATRERPKLVFDVHGQMTHLINGVCGAPSCTDSPKTGCMDCKYHHWDFTLIQPIQQQRTLG
eukprot:m.289665 g.289665  ORF g.289665 m.289665 type:complete len:449 (-) comp27112_c0_seq3:3594-4940(-)